MSTNACDVPGSYVISLTHNILLHIICSPQKSSYIVFGHHKFPVVEI